jgi:Zn ribbon nucleic-acid-binding protein
MSICFVLCLDCGHNENNSTEKICVKCGSTNVDLDIELDRNENV